MDFQDLNNRLAELKQGLTRKIEIDMGAVFIEISRLHGEIRIRSEVYQELARLRAENAAMEQRHLEDIARIQTLKSRLKEYRKEDRNPQLRRISA
jgi:predicted nuclease with TOPRIM domain